MARVTNYIVQSFIAGRGASLKAMPAQPCKTAEQARRLAEKLSSHNLGVVAFETSGDPDTGDYDEQPIILFKAGQLPPQFGE